MSTTSAVVTVQQLFELLDKSGITYRDAAEKAGLSHVSIWKWKTGKSSPTIQNIENVLTVLGYRLEIVKNESNG